MDYRNATGPNINETAEFVHPSKLDYIVIDSKKALAIPALMFALGVVGNGLAIASLLIYKYKRIPIQTSRTCSSVCNPSPNVRDGHDDHELGIELQGRRASAAVHNRRDIATYKRRRRKNTFGPFHTLVLALISVDLVGNVATAPLTLFLYSSNTTILAAGGWHLCNYSAFAMMFLGIVTMASLTAMAVERVLSIQCPYFYHRHVKPKTANIVICITTIICAIFSLLPVVGFGEIRPMFPYTWCFANWQATQAKDMVFNYIYAISGILMIITTLICNVTVVIGLFKMKCRMTAPRHRKSTIRRETQMIIQLIVMTIIYLVCWLPLMIRILDNQLTRRMNVEADRIAIWLAAANPILDPWVYILLRRSVVRRLVKFTKSTCLSHVQSNLTIVVHPPPPPDANGEQKELHTVQTPLVYQPLENRMPLPTFPANVAHLETSPSMQSIYENASLPVPTI